MISRKVLGRSAALVLSLVVLVLQGCVQPRPRLTTGREGGELATGRIAAFHGADVADWQVADSDGSRRGVISNDGGLVVLRGDRGVERVRVFQGDVVVFGGGSDPDRVLRPEGGGPGAGAGGASRPRHAEMAALEPRDAVVGPTRERMPLPADAVLGEPEGEPRVIDAAGAEAAFARASRALREGRAADAIEALEEAVRLDAESGRFRAELATVLKELGLERYTSGDPEGAERYWRRAVEVAPGDDEARRFLERAEATTR